MSLVELLIVSFIWSYWYHANKNQYRFTTQDSRTMYVDLAKTMITASGVAVALLASLSLNSNRPLNHAVTAYAKVAGVCLIVCVCMALVHIIALSRGHELAKARMLLKLRAEGHTGPIQIQEGELTNGELLCSLISGGLALSGFFIGFLFLGRLIFHL